MEKNPDTPRPGEHTVAITGSGGSGVVTTGQILLSAAARAGYYGLMTRSAGPQIRGGESAAMVRLGPLPVRNMGDRFDLLIGLDWRNIERFADEIPLDAQSRVLADAAAGELPEALGVAAARLETSPFKARADEIEGGRANMVALGCIGARLHLPLACMVAGMRTTLARKGEAVMDAAEACIRAGFGDSAGDAPLADLPSARWSISGNEASGLGALRGGIRFVAAYPITPASEMLEWLAPRLERVGGSLLQAEDELASVNMIIGASFGGVPSLTATSGPGLSLMMEGLGLAVASETPIVVADVMRGGPSTGIPTKSEQSDLNLAIYGFHGDAPHLVLAALDIADAAFTTQWATRLAEHLQSVAIVLTDQLIGQSRAIIDPPRSFEGQLSRRLASTDQEHFQRYALTDDGISPMPLPGTPGLMYTADGLEHNRQGTPSSGANDHSSQSEKRLKKLEDFEFGDDWAEVTGDGPNCILTWGSSTGAALEAAASLQRSGHSTRVIAMRLIAPLARERLVRALDGMSQVLVVEQNQGAQLYHYLNAQRALPPRARSLAHPGPLALRPGEIRAALHEGA